MSFENSIHFLIIVICQTLCQHKKLSPKSIDWQAGCQTLSQGDKVGAPQSSGLIAAHGPGIRARPDVLGHWAGQKQDKARP